MASKLSQLTPASTAGATDLLYVVQSSTSKSITTANLLTSVAANILPSVTDTYTLGTSTKRWKSLYLTGESSIYLGSNTVIRSDANGNVRISIGSQTLFANVDGTLKLGSNVVTIASGNSITGLKAKNYTQSEINNLNTSLIGIGDILYNSTADKLQAWLGANSQVAVWANVT